MKRVLTALFIFVFISGFASAQNFQEKAISIGPNIGLVEYGAFYGLRAEYGLTKNIGLGLDLGYYHFSEDWAFPNGMTNSGADEFKMNYNAYSFMATGSYHFFPESRFDPYVRAGLGYRSMSFSMSFGDEDTTMFGVGSAYPSVLAGMIEAGVRFHINDVISFRTSFSYPYYFTTGFDITFNRPELSESERIKKAEKEAKEAAEARYKLQLGYYIGGNAATILSIPNGMKFKPNCTFPDAGFSLLVPFGKQSPFGFMLNAGYSQLAYSTYPNEFSNDSNTVKETYGFFSIQPMIYMGGFTLGVRYGIPQSAKAKDGNDKNVLLIVNSLTENSASFSSLDKSYIEHQLDVVVGGSIKLAEFESGDLRLNIAGSYALNPLYKDYKQYLPGYETKISGDKKTYIADKKYNPTPVTLSFGLSYLFNLGF